MKKILFTTILLIVVLFTSCSSSSENDLSDPIIGVWNPFYYIDEYGERFAFDDCKTKTSYSFKIDGTGYASGYGDVNGTCINRENSSFSWINNGIKTYTVSFLDLTDRHSLEFTINDNNDEFTHFGEVGGERSGQRSVFKKQ
jgi:hypothetical protein